MASITQDIKLRHAPTKSAPVEPITLTAGTPVTIVKEWKHHYLIKTGEGHVFNVRKEFVDPGGS
ncbi:MAG: hypothetical protein ACE5HU_07995 [Acidobacteriota bacterium]